jgi:hypothetical protein
MDFTIETDNNSEAAHPLESETFVWARFREYFPFGDVSLRERRYEDILSKVLDGFKTDRERTLLLDMLDIQTCVLLEQVWIQQEQTGSGGQGLFFKETHIASSRLSCHSMLRQMYHLPSKTSGRSLLLSVQQTMTLFDLLGRGEFQSRPSRAL